MTKSEINQQMKEELSAVWTLVSPKPPPRHGASRAVEILLEGPTEGVEWRHVNASYTESIAELQKFSFRKVVLLARYLWEMLLSMRGSSGVVLTPSFQMNTFLKDSLFIWVARLFGRKPIVAWYHMRFETMNYSSLGRIRKWYVKRTLMCVSSHVCVAPSLLNGMPEFLAKGSLFSVTNGIPALCGSVEVVDSDSSVLNILYVSNFTENKGWRLLQEVAEELCSGDTNLNFDFYGAPTRECSIADIEGVFSGGLNRERIRYRGILGDSKKYEVFNDADILAFPSFNEAFPITLLEAMSVGIPIVATDVGGIADAVVSDKGGYVVPAKDKVAFKQALEKLIGSPDLRRAFGQFNKGSFESSFTDEAFCESWALFLKGRML